MIPQLPTNTILKMTWQQVLAHYFPHLSAQQRDYILWNETCYPFDHQRALEELYRLANDHRTTSA